MHRFTTPQPFSPNPVVTRASQPVGAKAPLNNVNNAAVYFAAPTPQPATCASKDSSAWALNAAALAQQQHQHQH
jgi:hypothetical protein